MTRRAGEQESLIEAAMGVGSLLCGTIAIWEWLCLINDQNILLATFSLTRELEKGERDREQPYLWLVTVMRFKYYADK